MTSEAMMALLFLATCFLGYANGANDNGFAANLATALLVNTASDHGLPVSTTHVSVGSLVGIGITIRQVKWKPVTGVLLSWIVTLPCAAVLAALAYLVLRPL